MRRFPASLAPLLLLLCAPTIYGQQGTAFTPSFVGGKYRSDYTKNALTDGADRLSEIGATAINIYFDPGSYADDGAVPSEQWVNQPPASTLVQRAQQPLFYKVLSNPKFHIVSLNVYPMGYWDDPQGQEFHDLTVWLRNTFRGTGKIFILKNWEGDYHLIGLDQSLFTMTYSAPYDDCKLWINRFKYWQLGVARGRADTPNSDVQVYRAVEVVKVQQAMAGTVVRLSNLLPYIAPDMVVYSAYDSMNDSGYDYNSVRSNLTNAISFLRDPAWQLRALDYVGYTSRFQADGLFPNSTWTVPANRVAITEFGVNQNQVPSGYSSIRSDDEVRWRIQATVDAARASNILYAVWWHIYDNECGDISIGDCAGWWLLRTDGSRSVALQTLNGLAWQCELAPKLPQVQSARQPAPNVFYWGDPDNNLVWDTWPQPGIVLNYRTQVSPPDTGTGGVDNGTGSWYTVSPQAPVGVYTWSVTGQGRMCDGVKFGPAFTIVPPPPKNVRVFPGTHPYLGDPDAKLLWDQIPGPSDMTYEVSITGASGTTQANVGSATQYSLTALATGDYTYSVRTKAGGIYTVPAATGAFSIGGPPPCPITSLSLGGGFYASAAGTASFDVVADPQCQWSAVVDGASANWITIDSPTKAVSGNGTVTFDIKANTAPGTPGNPTSPSLPRYGKIIVNQKVFFVNQAGVTPPQCPLDSNHQPTFSIRGPSTIRPDQNLALVAYPGAGFHYQWSMSPAPNGLNGIIGNDSPELFIRPDNGNPYYPRTNGATTYYVLVSSANCPNGVQVSFTVTVSGSPAACTLPTATSTGVVLSPFIGAAVPLGVGPEPSYFPWTPEKPSFQWYTGPSGDTSNPIQGATNDTYLVAPTVDSMYWVKMTNSCGGVQLSGTALVIVGVPPPKHRAASHNFSHTGKTDLLFRDPTTGDNVLQPIDNNATLAPIPLPSFDAAWQAQAVSDLNGDGQPDIVWRNPATGANAYWPMYGTFVRGSLPLPTQDPSWNLNASADFTADGAMDLVWQSHSTSDLELWIMNGTEHAGSYGLGRLPAGWVLQGSADFDGDGKPDLVFRNYRTGENAIWHMDDATPPGFAVLSSQSGSTALSKSASLAVTNTSTSNDGMPGVIESLPDTNWRIASIDDADGDGAPDIIWSNSATNELMYWKMSGTNRVATMPLPPQTNPNLKIAGVPPVDISSQTQATTLTLNAPAAGFGGSTTLTAALSAGSTPVAGRSIAFTIDGTAAGSAVTAVDGTASVVVSVAGLPAGLHTVDARFSGDATYGSSSASSSLQILPGTVQITWTTPAPIVYGTALGAAQLNATAPVPGAFVYTPAAGTILDAGANQTLSVTFMPADTASYSPATASVTITVTKAAQTIAWATPPDIVYGVALSAAQLNASVTVPGPASAGSISYDPAAGTVLSAGDHALTAIAAATADYNAATATVTLHVRPATPAVAWATPAAITYGTPLSSAQLNATASVPGTFDYAPAPGTVLTAGTHVLQVTFTPADGNDFTTATADVTLTVQKATPILQWPRPADIVYGTALSPAQLNATSSVDGSFVYTPAAGTILNAGAAQTLQTIFTPADTNDYSSATASVQISVLKAAQTIAWQAPAPITYGTPLSSAQLNAIVNGPGPSPAGALTYAPAAGSVLHAGTATLTVTAAETPNYTAASASVALTIRKATPAINWPAPAAITYGTALSAKQLNATADVDGTFTYTPPAGTILDAGTQQLQAAFAPADAQDYENATATANFTVNKAPQQITWATPAAAVYGTPLSGAQLNASVSVVGPAPAGALTYLPVAGTVLDAGAQTLTVTAAETRDYLPATQNVTLTVTKAPLSVTAANATKRYGALLPSFTGTLVGVVNHDALTPLFTTTATVNSPVGTYPIAASIADPNNRLRNYVVTSTGATLTVTAAPLSISAVNVSKQYSDPLPPFTVIYDGFVLGETPAVLGGSLAFSTTVTRTTAPGQYALGVGGVSSPNYAIQFVPGAITVTQEDARVTFTGPHIESATGPASGTAAVTLSATVADISATPDANGDTWPGDIVNATLTFVDRATGATLCTAPLGLVRSDVPTIAAGTCTWTTPLTATNTVTIGMVVGGYYTRKAAADDVALLLQVPTNHFVTGGGFLIAAKSAGDLAADSGSPLTINAEARYDTGQTLLHGSVSIGVQHTDSGGSKRTYEIAVHALGSLGVDETETAAAIAGANATITDVTDAKAPFLIASNAIVVLTASQPDKAHAATIGVTVWKPAGGLWLATNSNGTQTVEQALDGGAIQIH